jgi:UDP-N-acetylmuramate dehydrogenase
VTLPPVRGKYRVHAELGKTTWFQVGGAADVLFRPEDAQDLADFLKAKPKDAPVTALGVGSNVIIRDGGVEGVVVKLGRGFAGIASSSRGAALAHASDVSTGSREFSTAPASRDPVLTVFAKQKHVPHDDGLIVTAGAAALNYNVAQVAQQQGIAGLEFLVGIPGGIGGGLRMNAGAYGTEIKDVLIAAEAVDAQGNIHQISAGDMDYTYRHCGLPEDWIFTRAFFGGRPGRPEDIMARMREISARREATQPIREKTGGSTFKNPPGHKAWELIDAAGCRGLRVGGAQVSEKHCNFLINTGTATAKDLEDLGEDVRKRVFDKSGIMLEWEIKRIGRPV